MNDWLQELKAGDDVVIQTGEYGHTLSTVERVTPAQIVVGGQKFWRVSGAKVGMSSREIWTRLTEATPEAKAKIQRNRKMRWLVQGVKWSRLNDEALNTICDTIEAQGMKRSEWEKTQRLP